MSAAEGVPLTRELLEALVEAAGMQSDMARPNVNLANVWYAVKQKCAAALASDAGTPEVERCPYCSFAPESLNDYCNKHRPTFFSAAPASGDASGETRLGDLLDHMLAEHGAAISPTAMSRDERCAHVDLRDSYKADILRLYRAATGEVVGTADVIVHYEDGDEYLPDIVPHPDCCNGRTESYTVDLVLRRGKEGV